jgi:pyruvate formate lyase activating enzyme
MSYVADYRIDKCLDCGSCRELVPCPRGKEGCIGCGACALACPYEAIEMVEVSRERRVSIHVNGQKAFVPERISLREALQLLGCPVASCPGEEGIFAPCQVGGCWSCAIEVDGFIKQACITPVKDGLTVNTFLPRDYTPKRIVHGFMGHTVGGVGTPWYLKGTHCIEVACFAAGCNFRCRQCQNWTTAYCGKGKALTPREVAKIMTKARKRFGVDRMAISGGECTLNRPWLIGYLRELRSLNPDKRARLHVDTNGSVLTSDYIDELVEAGMTDVGIDLKGLETDTFIKITGLKDRELALKYKEMAWHACQYVFERYQDRIFLGVGIPYNQDLISLSEIDRIGMRIRDEIDPSVQVCVLDYRPEFRSSFPRPTYEQMKKVHQLLRGVGLTTVICQTEFGHITP